MHYLKTIPYLLGLLLLFSATAQPDNLVFRHITISNGLPAPNITSLAQDSSGFIWIGSNEGLFRYDGFNFKEFNHKPGNPKSIPCNAITKIYVTKSGLIWIATVESGIACMERSGRIVRIINSSNTPSFTKISDYSIDFLEDSLGNIWCGTHDGLYQISTDGKVDRFQTKSTLPKSNSFYNLIFDKSGNLWLGCLAEGLMIFNPSTGLFTHAADAPYNIKSFKEKIYFHSLVIYKENLWYSTWLPDVGVYNTVKKKNTMLYNGKNFPRPDFSRMANTFYIDSKNNLWVGTGEGLCFSSGTSSFEKSYLYDAGNRYSIINNWVTSILEDREGNFWFGTKEGISIAQPYKKQITNLSLHNKKQFQFGDKEISNIIEADSNTLLVCTTMADGIYETDLDFKIKKHYSFNQFAYDWIWKYYHDKPRQRIFISAQEGMLLYNTKTHSLKKIPSTLNYNINTISSFVSTSDSIVWMSRFNNSFLKYNLNNDTYKEYQLEDLGEKKQHLILSKDKNNHLWIMAHSTGIFQFDDNTEKITQRLTPDNNNTNSILQTGVWFFIDLDEYYLIGYQSRGISLYNKKNKTFQHFTQADGLASNNTTTAIASDDNKVWIATQNGISLFDPATKSFKNYGYNQGILNNNFVSIAKLQDGRIAAGTNRGLVVFTPNNLDLSATLHPPLITGINVYGMEISVDSLLLKNTPLQISYKENYVSFDFISPQYNNNQQIQYAYKLEGVDNDWVECGNRRFTSYTNIKGGQYFFKIKARMPDGEWFENKNALKVHVSAAFYKQWWFYFICVLVFTTVVYIIFHYRLQQVRRMERMRSSISGDLHDEVGASLTSISIFSEMAKKSVTPNSKEAEYLQRIGDRSRDSIEKMSDIIWSINPDNDNMQQMLIRMKNYALEVADAKDVGVNWNEEGNLTQALLSMEQRKNFYLLFKEIMNNAIKHAAAKNISIQLLSADSHISMLIKDDGKGFDTSTASAGNGLKSMHRRAGLLLGNINISSEKEKGTTVKLEFRY